MKRAILLFLILLLLVLPAVASEQEIVSEETVMTEIAWVPGYGAPLPDG